MRLNSYRIPTNKKSPTFVEDFFLFLSDPEGIRTPDRLLRRQMLYPTELRDRSSVKKERQPSCLFFVGVAGFEPTTSCSQSRRDTGLRYTPRFTSSDGEIGFRPWRQGATRYRATLHPEISVFRRRDWFSTLAPRRHALPGYATPRP